MQWSTQTVSSSLENFGFRDEEAEDTTQENGSDCDGGYIQFQGTESAVGDRWCGMAFNSVEAATTGGTMHSTWSDPWTAQVVAEEQEDTDEGNAPGFSLIAQQKACTSSYGGDATQEN